jgi:hypothetical protein
MQDLELGIRSQQTELDFPQADDVRIKRHRARDARRGQRDRTGAHDLQLSARPRRRGPLSSAATRTVERIRETRMPFCDLSDPFALI